MPAPTAIYDPAFDPDAPAPTGHFQVTVGPGEYRYTNSLASAMSTIRICARQDPNVWYILSSNGIQRKRARWTRATDAWIYTVERIKDGCIILESREVIEDADDIGI